MAWWERDTLLRSRVALLQGQRQLSLLAVLAQAQLLGPGGHAAQVEGKLHAAGRPRQVWLATGALPGLSTSAVSGAVVGSTPASDSQPGVPLGSNASGVVPSLAICQGAAGWAGTGGLLRLEWPSSSK